MRFAGAVNAIVSFAFVCGGTLLSGEHKVETTEPATCSILNVDQIVAKMIQADTNRRACLQQYSVTRRYTLQTERMKKSAEMVVRGVYRKGEGKSFEILSSEGAEGISGHVLRHLLDAEAEASRKEPHGQDRVTPQHYDFQLLGMENRDGRLCYVLTLKTKAKSKYLLNGKAWIDARDFAIVHMEGKPSASLSFWVGKPYISMDFEKVGDFWVIARNQSYADARLVGASELTIEYRGYQIQGTSLTASLSTAGAVTSP